MKALYERRPLCREKSIYKSSIGDDVRLGNHSTVRSSTKKRSPSQNTDYGRLMAISQILTYDIIFGIYYIFGLVLKSNFFCRKKNWLMKIMNKGLTVPKRIVQSKIPQIPQNLFVRFSQLSQTFEISLKKASSGVCSPCLRIWCQVFYKTWQSSHTSSPFYKGRGHTWQHDPPRHLQSD